MVTLNREVSEEFRIQSILKLSIWKPCAREKLVLE